jgi:hypothetical protein
MHWMFREPVVAQQVLKAPPIADEVVMDEAARQDQGGDRQP